MEGLRCRLEASITVYGGSEFGGGGGGSYNSGTNQDNQSGVNEGHGKVIISFIGN